MSWQIIKNNWSTTTIEDQHGNTICTLSIEDQATEDNQMELENDMARTATLIKASPDLCRALDLLLEFVEEGTSLSYDAVIAEAKQALAKARGEL